MNQISNIISAKKYNTKLYPIYKALSWDLLFYYSISFLFLTQTKGMSASMVLLVDAFYPIFKFLLQIPCATIVGKFGNRNSVILGNALVCVSVFLLIPATGLAELILSQFFSAFGYALKGLTETNLLYDSIPNSKKRNDLFSTIDGKSSSYYYYIDAISSCITGFLFVFNGYLPIAICLILCILSTLLCIRFKETSFKNDIEKKEKMPTFRSSLSDLKQAFRFIFASKRLKDLILFYSFMSGILAILTSLRSSILTDIKLPEQYFGIIFAILGIISGIASHQSNWFHKHFRNRALKVFGMMLSISMIVVRSTYCISLEFWYYIRNFTNFIHFTIYGKRTFLYSY